MDIYREFKSLGLKSVIHIGTNKTGTSSLQDFFYHNRSKLLESGYLYPEIGIDISAHHDLARAIKKDPEGLKSSHEFRMLESSAGFGSVLFSSESFHTITDTRKMSEVFPPDSTTIVLYIREHASYLSSWYQQAVQARNTSIAFEEFIELFSADYRKLISRWTDIYGKENVKVRLYDRKHLQSGDIIEDFLTHHLNLNLEDFDKLEYDRNPSISGNLLFIKKLLNNVITKEESHEIVYEIAELAKLDRSFGGKLAFDEKIMKKIAHMYRFDRKWLLDEYGIKVKPIRESQPGNEFPSNATLEEDFKKIVGFSSEHQFKIIDYLGRLKFLGTW